MILIKLVINLINNRNKRIKTKFIHKIWRAYWREMCLTFSFIICSILSFQRARLPKNWTIRIFPNRQIWKFQLYTETKHHYEKSLPMKLPTILVWLSTLNAILNALAWYSKPHALIAKKWIYRKTLDLGLYQMDWREKSGWKRSCNYVE